MLCERKRHFLPECWIEGDLSAKEAVVGIKHLCSFFYQKNGGPEGDPEGGFQILSPPTIDETKCSSNHQWEPQTSNAEWLYNHILQKSFHLRSAINHIPNHKNLSQRRPPSMCRSLILNTEESPLSQHHRDHRVHMHQNKHSTASTMQDGWKSPHNLYMIT